MLYNTQILMADGSYREAGAIRLGDTVQGAKGPNTVIETIESQARRFFRINDAIVVTGLQPFLGPYGEGLSLPEVRNDAINMTLLTKGCGLLLSDGDYVLVDKIEQIDLKEPEKCVAVIVDGDHTMYANGIGVSMWAPITSRYAGMLYKNIYGWEKYYG
jgi:hypothetical protein